MFTGIIEHMGQVQSIIESPDGESYQIRIRHHYPDALALGESIAVMGVCLTVTQSDRESFAATISPTTREITTLSALQPGHAVNLERPLTPESRLGGHLVQGHVDERGHVLAVAERGDARDLTLAGSAHHARLLVEKGSIAIDGVSLTIVGLSAQGFHVTLIPHTLYATTLEQLQPGQEVNLEYDVMAKYVARLAAPYLPKG